MLPTLQVMIGPRAPTRPWLREAAEHITEFSLGGMKRIAAGARRPRRRTAGR